MDQGDDIKHLIVNCAIGDVLSRYARGIDRLDESLVLSTYHDDATDDHLTIRGAARVVIPRLLTALRGYECTHHQISNVVVELSGDRAVVESSVIAHHIARRGPDLWMLTFGGRYLDVFTDRGGWRVQSRRVVHDWDDGRRIEHRFKGVGPITGRRDLLDPSYEHFRASGWDRS